MADSSPMDLDTLRSIIKREHTTALGQDGGQLSADRLRSLEYYEGEMKDLPRVEGRSQVVMRSVLEAVEWVLPALLRIFTASDKIAEFEPIGTDNPQLLKMREAAAEQATAYVSYIFYRDNPGFVILHDWFKDALIEKLGWVKVYWDDSKTAETNTFSGLSAEEYAAIEADPNVEVLEKRDYPGPPEGQSFYSDSPDPETPTLYDCTIRVSPDSGRVKIVPVPPEEILFSRRAKNPALGPLPFICHKVQRNYGDLLGEGYDAEMLGQIGGWNRDSWNTERTERHLPEDENPSDDERADPAMRIIWIEENYIRVDYDGDGIPELRKIVTAAGGAHILTKDGEPDIELVDEVPLLPICPVPMPHKLTGMSLADLVMDLQQIKTALMRQMLDNVYLTNNPRWKLNEKDATENTMDDLLTSRPGAGVRMKDISGLEFFEVPFVAEKAFQVLEYIDQTQETRTGVSRRNQGLNPDDLNKTAAAAAMYQEAAAQRVELIARIFAETGVKELARRILGLVTRYQQHERIIRLTGKWVPMDPRQWSRNMDTTVSVGLGTGNKDQILMHLEKIMAAQLQIATMQGGVQGPLVYAKDVYDALEYGTEQMGLKQSFFTDPSQPPPERAQPQQQKPDPAMAKVQAQVMADQARQQASVEADKRKEQFDMQRDQQRAQFDSQMAEREFQHRTDLAQQEFQLKRWEAEQNAALKQRELQMRLEAEQREMEMKAAAGAYDPKPTAGASA